MNVNQLPGRGVPVFAGNGRTLTAGMASHLEGTMKMFEDLDPSVTSSTRKVFRSNRWQTCILVQNVSGIALEPKRLVKFASGYRGRRVDGYANASVGEVAGVVDEHLNSSGVAANDYFWLVVKGPCLVKTSLAGDAENVIALDAPLVALTAATSQATTSGRAVAQAATTNVTFAASWVRNMIGRALSAKTTANTNADVLTDLCLMT